VDLVGINLLSEEGQTSQVVGEMLALRMRRQAGRLEVAPRLGFFPVTIRWVECTFWCDGCRSG